MKVKVDTTGLHESRWYQYAVRFAFGGAITAATGIIAKRCGPEIGGLFLAFPAILPATATLIEKHEREKKERAGQNGTAAGRKAAGVDAAGAAMGCIGLITFAVIIWKGLPDSSLPVMLSVATVAWLAVSISVWLIREKLWRSLVRKLRRSQHSLSAIQQAQSSIHRSQVRRVK